MSALILILLALMTITAAIVRLTAGEYQTAALLFVFGAFLGAMWFYVKNYKAVNRMIEKLIAKTGSEKSAGTETKAAADAWRAEVRRQAEQRAEEDRKLHIVNAGPAHIPEEDRKAQPSASPAASPVSRQSSTKSGTCGENLTWTLEDGVLTISGKGKLTTDCMGIEDGPEWPEASYDNYHYSPWAGPGPDGGAGIRKVIIGEGITELDTALFRGTDVQWGREWSNGHPNLAKIVLPSTITKCPRPIKGVTILISKDNPVFPTADGILYSADGTYMPKNTGACRKRAEIPYIIENIDHDFSQITIPSIGVNFKKWPEAGKQDYRINGYKIKCPDRSAFELFAGIVEKEFGWPHVNVQDKSYTKVDSAYYDLDNDILPDYGINNDVMWGLEFLNVEAYAADYPKGSLTYEDGIIELSINKPPEDKLDAAVVRAVAAFVKVSQK